MRIVRSLDTLYVGYEAEDTDITATYENRDDPTYKDDCVEIFIKPSQETDSYFGMEMNARGVLYDYFYPFPKGLDKDLNFEGVQLKTTLRGTLNQRKDQDNGWTLEVAIPFKNFTPLSKELAPKSGEKWRVQVNRWDGTEDSAGRRLSMWCHPGLKKANPHNPERFGFVVFQVALGTGSRFRGNDAEGNGLHLRHSGQAQREPESSWLCQSCGYSPKPIPQYNLPAHARLQRLLLR